MPRLLVFFFFILLQPCPLLFADTFETRMGKTLEGEIISEDQTYLYLDTPSDGTLNVKGPRFARPPARGMGPRAGTPLRVLQKPAASDPRVKPGASYAVRKMDILTVNGEPYHYMGQGTAPIKPEKSIVKQPIYLGPMSQEDKDLSSLPEPGKNIGVQFISLDKPESKPAGQAVPSAAKTHTIIHASGVTEEELSAYYHSRKEEFRMPVQLRLKFINPPAMTESPQGLLKNPSASKAWKDAGWMKKGDTFNNLFSPAACGRIFNMKKGETLLIEDADGLRYLFWASDRKESYIMPYEQARPKILTKILQEKTR